LNLIIKTARRFARDLRGASMMEYALMLALVAIICLAAIAQFGATINGFFSSFASTI